MKKPKSNQSIIKEFPWKSILLISVILIGLFLVVFSYCQNEYLALRIFDKQIASIRIVSYDGDAFVGFVQRDSVITDQTEVFGAMMTEINYAQVCLFHPKQTSEIAFITFSDGTSVNAYIDNNKIGLNYGQIWLYVRNLQEITAVSE